MKSELENNSYPIEQIKQQIDSFAYSSQINFQKIYIALFKILRLITIKENVSQKFVKRTIELLTLLIQSQTFQSFVKIHKNSEGVIQFGYVTKYLDKLSQQNSQCEHLSLQLKNLYRYVEDAEYSSQDSQTILKNPQISIERFYRHMVTFIPIEIYNLDKQIKRKIDIVITEIQSNLNYQLNTTQQALLYLQLINTILTKYDSKMLYYTLGRIVNQISYFIQQQYSYDIAELQAKIIYVLNAQILQLLQNSQDLDQKQYCATYLIQFLIYTPDNYAKDAFQDAQEHSIKNFGFHKFLQLLIRYKQKMSLFQMDLIITKYEQLFQKDLQIEETIQLLVALPSQKVCKLIISLLSLQYQKRNNLLGIEFNFILQIQNWNDYQLINKEFIEKIIENLSNKFINTLQPDQKYLQIITLISDYEKENKLPQVLSRFQMYCLQLINKPPIFSYHQLSIALETEQLSFVDYYQMNYYYYIFGINKELLAVGITNNEFLQIIDYFKDFYN